MKPRNFPGRVKARQDRAAERTAARERRTPEQQLNALRNRGARALRERERLIEQIEATL